MKEYSFDEFQELDDDSERVKKIIYEENRYNYDEDGLDFAGWFYANIKWVNSVLNDVKLIRKEKLKKLNK